MPINRDLTNMIAPRKSMGGTFVVMVAMAAFFSTANAEAFCTGPDDKCIVEDEEMSLLQNHITLKDPMAPGGGGKDVPIPLEMLKTSSEVSTLNLEALRAFDEDGDGVLHKDELDAAMMVASMPQSEMGPIPLEMLMTLYEAHVPTLNLEDLRALDEDGDGALHQEELDTAMLALMPRNEMGAEEKNEVETAENVETDRHAENVGVHFLHHTAVLTACQGFPTDNETSGPYSVSNLIEKYVKETYNDFLFNRGMDRVKIRLLHYDKDMLSASPASVIIQFEMACGTHTTPDYELAQDNGRCPKGQRYITDWMECLLGKYSTSKGGPIETKPFKKRGCQKGWPSSKACFIWTGDKHIYRTNENCKWKSPDYKTHKPICSSGTVQCRGTEASEIPDDFCKFFQHPVLYQYMFKPAFAGKMYGEKIWDGYDAAKELKILCTNGLAKEGPKCLDPR